MIIKKQNLKKIITIGLISFTIATIPPIKVFAIWNQDNNGWWYSEGSEYSIGWKQIDGEWYYFNNNGSMAKILALMVIHWTQMEYGLTTLQII
ncbi:hypothetical protein AXY43_04180 [Clostridium sp. MF28]|uniref:hypothetical protein n=1 Tax=Clostridium TaxID=1485 RepID=UPI000D226055|nr:MULTISPECIES: hypothetical protein [Clostridium]AVK47282.1 hypothetical protein AXY43_04180 [Clostridium sp. MF28]